MQNWWFIGGRMKIGESERVAAHRCIARETRLVIDQEKLIPVTMTRHHFNSRQQEPQNLGCDSLCYNFALELGPRMVDQASNNLDKQEYEEVGLKAFDRAELVKEKVDQAVIDIYDLIFP